MSASPDSLGLVPRRRRRGLDFPFATINVVLLLLLFFVVTGSIVGKNESGVTAPSADQRAASRLPRPLLVVDAAGHLFLDDEPVARAELAAHARAALSASSDPSPSLSIYADRSGSGGAFLTLVEQLRAARIPVRIVMRGAPPAR
jgi:biopolymer transport protein ExbD